MNNRLPNVVALGAVYKIEDLTAPPRQPTLDGLGYVLHTASNEIDILQKPEKKYKLLRRRKFYTTVSSKSILEERREALKLGTPYFIEVDPVSVHAASFRVEFGPRVKSELRQYAR